MVILGIETSCDETALALIDDEPRVIAHRVASQIDLHKIFGGVLPEASSRRHLEVLYPMYKDLLKEAGGVNIDVIAVTMSPGLQPALLMGASFGRALAAALKIPIVGVDHVIAHGFVAKMEYKSLDFPYRALIVSGGHTVVVEYEGVDKVHLIADTRDDALGEVLDKVGRVMGIDYPAGPEIDRMAISYGGNYPRFTIPKFKDETYDFSFSGMKTAARLAYEKKGYTPEAVARGLMEAAVKQIIIRLKAIEKERGHMPLVVGGGVAASKFLRRMLKDAFSDVYFVSPHLCTDNGVMIAYTGMKLFKKGMILTPDDEVDPVGVLWRE